jgi:hypothetical protein
VVAVVAEHQAQLVAWVAVVQAETSLMVLQAQRTLVEAVVALRAMLAV